MKYTFICLTLLISISSFGQKAERWTLKQCIDYAIDHNISVQQNQLQGEIIQNNLNQSKLNRLPTLNGSGSHNYNIGRTIDPFTNTFSNTSIQNNSFSLNSGVVLYGGSQVTNTIKQNKISYVANKKSTEVLRNQVVLTVVNTYLQIIQAEENIKIAKSQLEITEDQLSRAKKLANSGATDQSTTLNLEAQLANDRVNLVNAQNSIQIGYNSLMNVMQYPLDQSLELQNITIQDLPELPTESVAAIYELALSNIPEIAEAELRIEQNIYGEKIAQGGLQPSLRAFGNINTVYSESGQDIEVVGNEVVTIGATQNSLEPVVALNPILERSDKPFSNQLSDNLGQQLGVSLSVPIFNGYRSRTSVENARINTQISELNLISVKAQLRNDITTAHTNMKVAKSRYDAAQSSFSAQQTNFEFSEKRFEAGLINSTELLTAKNQWNQAQIQALNAKYEYVFRKLIIDFYKGLELTL